MHKTLIPVRDECPTRQTYEELQLAYDHFNTALFNGRLPDCLITLQRTNNRTFGYFAPKRFATAGGKIADEIALNPRHFKNRTLIEVTSTLVHEMVHVWQFHYGHPSRANYHNKEWAGEMLRLGLRPSHTGAPGGRMTGQGMSHYVLPGGRFEKAAEDLFARRFGITWFDVDAAVLVPTGLGEFLADPGPTAGRRTKFRCPECDAQAWGKPSLNLICGECERQMQPAHS